MLLSHKLPFVLLLLWTTYGLEKVYYEGLRLDMSALTLNRDILASIIPALNRTEQSTFKSYNESGSFGTHLQINNVKIPYFKINEERFDMNRFEFAFPIYKIKGQFEAILFHITFRFHLTWLGIPLVTGTGSAAVTNTRNEILVFWNESDPDVQLPHPWDIKNLTLSTWIQPTSWVTTLLHTKFIHDFHTAVDDAMYDFAHNLLKTYRYIEDIFPDDIDLVFRNEILSVQPTVGGAYLTIAFKTNITVDMSIHKKMYRKVLGTVVPKGNFDYCLAAQLVPDVMDALGKAGYYDEEIDYKTWGFASDKVKEFFDIFPVLREKYSGSETFAIHCQSSRTDTTNDVTQREWEDPLLELQHPVYCFVYVADTGEYILIADIFFRFYYELKCKVDAFYGHVRAAALKGFRTTPILPESRRLLLEEHLQTYTTHFYDRELVSPGIKVTPNREKELIFDWAYTMSEEICFYYKEKRPIIPINNTKTQ